MCDKCVERLRDAVAARQEAQAKAGVEALEALANGEEVPEDNGPIPLMVCEMDDKVGIITSRKGWELLRMLMDAYGGIREAD